MPKRGKSKMVRLISPESGFFYVIRIGADSDVEAALKEKGLRKYDPIVRKHLLFKIKKIK